MRYFLPLIVVFLLGCSATPEYDTFTSREASVLEECGFILKYAPEDVLYPIYLKYKYPIELLVYKQNDKYSVSVYNHAKNFTLHHTVLTFQEAFNLIEHNSPCESSK